MTAEMSPDMGATWAPSLVRRYTRRQPSEDFFPVRDDAGLTWQRLLAFFADPAPAAKTSP